MNNYLNTFQLEFLKWIAILTMVIDHIGRILFQDNEIMISIGRIAFPLFAFILSYNYIFHTTNKKQYIFRLLLLGIISQPFYMYAFDANNLNVLFTLSLGLILIFTIESLYIKTKNNIELFIGFIFIWIFFILLGFFVDYIHFGILIVFFFYLFLKTENLFKYISFIIISLLIILMNNDSSIFYTLFGLISLLFILTISKINIKIKRANKYVFYLFYPIHLLFLKILSLL